MPIILTNKLGNIYLFNEKFTKPEGVMGILVHFLRGICIAGAVCGSGHYSCDRYGIYRGKTGKI